MNSNALIDRLPITQGWHLVVLIVGGAVVVGIIHRYIRRRVARMQREAQRARATMDR